MKRLTAILLLILILPYLCACTREEMVYPVSYHYLRAPESNGEIFHGSADSVITPEIREGDGHQGDNTHFLEIYLLGPLDRDFRSPFPVGTALIDFDLEDSAATVLLSDHFGTLSGIDLTLACSCLTLTVMDLTGADTVTIMAEDALLDGKESVTIDRSNLFLTDDTVPETN